MPNGFATLSAPAFALSLAMVPTVFAQSLPPLTFKAERVYQGYGTHTRGGEGQAVYRVRNLNDGGPDSLRDALADGNRHIVFDVAGEIRLEKPLVARGAHITIDGDSAPSPGITVKNYGLHLRGSQGAHDIIVQGIRIRNTRSNRDGLQISDGAYNIVVDHVSIYGSGDGNLDISGNARDITISWSVLAEPAGTQKNMLIKYNPARITLHHNLFVNAGQRNPQVRIDDPGTPAVDTTVDMRNNVVWGWKDHGTLIWYGPRANVVNNFYSAAGGNPKRSLVVSAGARAYVAGNVSTDGQTGAINAQGTEMEPFDAPLVPMTDACTAAHKVVSGAGVRPRDMADQKTLAGIALPACAENDSAVSLEPSLRSP
jgi:pectate lyase